jgi:putative aldouronate transport system permease protein
MKETTMRKTKKGFFKTAWKYRMLLLMMLPAILYVILFNYLPMLGIVLSFKKFNYADGIFKSPWNGLDNFKFLIASHKLWPLTRNTLLYNLVFIITGIFFQVTFAIMLSEITKKVFKKVSQTLMFLPYFVSWVVVAALVQALFSYESGAVNSVIQSFGGKKIDIYSTTGIWPFLLTGFKIWKETGYGMIVYLASITGIDTSMYEAAEIDGATTLQRIFKITLPTIKPTIIIMSLLAIGQIFRGDFGLFYQLVGNNARVLEVADILDLYTFRALMTSSDVGMSAASGFYQSVLCFITIMAANGVIKKIEPDYSLF